jgi:hypothetical protein
MVSSALARRISAFPAWGVATALAIAYLVLDPPSADLAAQVYRTDLFERQGFVLWDNAWYAGHHVPGYSVLFPPLGALLGPRVVGALSAVAAAALFERVAAEHFGDRARAGALWFGAATAMNLVTGRLAFALGVAVALAAVLAATHRRHVLATVLAVATGLASPVAGLFLGLAAAAWFLARRANPALALGAGAAAPIVALSVAFPEGGIEPFVASSFWPALAGLGAVLAALPRGERELRVGVVLYALGTIASFVLDTPLGGNVTRLGTLFGGPVLACLLWRRSPALLAVLAVPLLYWQWNAPVRDWTRASDDPSIHASYYEGLLGFLATRDRPLRVEIPFTANHWEANHVARRFPLARGWERQLDVRDNAVFYRGRLTPGRYRAWLRANAVAYVALPDARLDHSAEAEARLIRAGLPYLRAVWSDAHWRVFAVRAPAPLATGATATALGTDSLDLRAGSAGSAVARVRFTPYWKIVEGAGCVSRAAGGWTRLRLTRPGSVRLATRFAPGRIASSGPRCTIG